MDSLTIRQQLVLCIGLFSSVKFILLSLHGLTIFDLVALLDIEHGMYNEGIKVCIIFTSISLIIFTLGVIYAFVMCCMRNNRKDVYNVEKNIIMIGYIIICTMVIIVTSINEHHLHQKGNHIGNETSSNKSLKIESFLSEDTSNSTALDLTVSGVTVRNESVLNEKDLKKNDIKDSVLEIVSIKETVTGVSIREEKVLNEYDTLHDGENQIKSETSPDKSLNSDSFLSEHASNSTALNPIVSGVIMRNESVVSKKNLNEIEINDKLSYDISSEPNVAGDIDLKEIKFNESLRNEVDCFNISQIHRNECHFHYVFARLVSLNVAIPLLQMIVVIFILKWHNSLVIALETQPEHAVLLQGEVVHFVLQPLNNPPANDANPPPNDANLPAQDTDEAEVDPN